MVGIGVAVGGSNVGGGFRVCDGVSDGRGDDGGKVDDTVGVGVNVGVKDMVGVAVSLDKMNGVTDGAIKGVSVDAGCPEMIVSRRANIKPTITQTAIKRPINTPPINDLFIAYPLAFESKFIDEIR